ncbi:glutathione S-transferase family protein [Mesorhizobium sp. A623]
MYTLYTRPGSGGFVVEAAFLLAGEPFEQIDVPKTDQPEAAFLKVSPLNKVPVLTLPDGNSMTESAAICILLAELHPDADLAPMAGSADRAQFLRWMAFMASSLYPADLRFYYPHRYTTDPDGQKAVRQAAVAEMDQGLAVIDAALADREWLVGDRLSIADIYLLMLFCWHPETARARATWPNIERLCRVLREHPVLKELNARHEMW